MRPEISVVICAHNPRPQYLQRVLDALKGQTLPADVWELVLVDNASDPRLTGARPSRLTAVEAARMVFHGMCEGLFRLRYDWAQVKGRSDAVAFIAGNRLEPLTAHRAGALSA